MRSLADTIARLSAFRSQQRAADYSSGPNRLQDLHDFGSNPGALKARKYIPDGMSENAALVVVLHGCLQTAAGYDHGSGWSTVADREGSRCCTLSNSDRTNPNKCFNWFLPNDTSRGSGEALSVYQMIERILEHGLDRRRIFTTGLSAGGAMAGAMLATYPEVFAGGAIIAGLPYGSQTLPEAFDRMRGHGGPSERERGVLVRQATEHVGPWPTVSIWHGSSDMTVVPSNGRAIASQWRAVHNLEARSNTHRSYRHPPEAHLGGLQWAGHYRRIYDHRDGSRDAIGYRSPRMWRDRTLYARCRHLLDAAYCLPLGLGADCESEPENKSSSPRQHKAPDGHHSTPEVSGGSPAKRAAVFCYSDRRRPESNRRCAADSRSDEVRAPLLS